MRIGLQHVMLYFLSDAKHSQSQGVGLYAELFGESPSMTDLGVSGSGVIPQNQLAIRTRDRAQRFIQLFEAVLQIGIVRFSLR